MHRQCVLENNPDSRSFRSGHEKIQCLWRPFFSGGSLLDPLLSVRTRMMSMLDPFDAFPLWDYTPSYVFAKDAQAVAKTSVDWWECHHVHYINADLSGTTKDDVEQLSVVADQR